MSSFKLQQPAPSPGLFQGFQQQQQQQQQNLQQQQQFQLQQQGPQQVHLVSADQSPLSYQAKWSDIHLDSQRLLLQIEERILEYRDESRRLDQCQRLYDSSALLKGFESDAARISQELSGIAAAVDREGTSLQELMQVAKDLIRNAEVAVRSFATLRHRLSRTSLAPASNASSTPAPPSSSPASLLFTGAHIPSVPAPSQAPSPVVEFYSGAPLKPSPFLQQTVSRFEHQLMEYRQRVEELERLLLAGGDKDNASNSAEYSILQSLPSVMSNIHDFFIHVAAEVESLHQQIGVLRTAFLTDRRRQGDESDPFLEADRREAAKQEAAARRVHPTLNAPSLLQPFLQATPSSIFGPATGAQAAQYPTSPSLLGTSSNLFPSSPAVGQSLFGAPSTPAQTSSLFGAGTQMPAFGSFGSAPATPAAPGSSLFGSTTPGLFSLPSSTFGSTTQSMFGSAMPAFGTPSTPAAPAFGGASPPGSLFGATPAAAGSPSPFGASPATGLFGANTSTSLFGTPSPGYGASGASLFGSGLAAATPTTSKPKLRGSRRK